MSHGFRSIGKVLREVAEQLPPRSRDAVFDGIRRALVKVA